jgi:hypothetical protein
MAYPYQMNPYQSYQPYQAYQQPQQPAYQGGILWGSYEEACAYPLGPNCAVTIWDRNQKSIYWKQSDAAGRQSIQILDYTNRSENPEPAKPAPELLTKEDIAMVISGIGQIQEMLKGGKPNE